MKKYILASLLSILFLTVSCSKEDIDQLPDDATLNDEINVFIWNGLNDYYLWQKDVPALADGNLNNFINENRNAEPENTFDNLLFQPGTVDRFSWIVDDYIALENQFQGISLSNGMEYKLFQNRSGSNGVYGVVYYVVPNSDAATKGVLRGMVFSAINGVQITTTNFRDVLGLDNYTLNLADFNAGNPIINGTTIDLVKEQLQENPISIKKVFNEGSDKIGYLLYNQFASSYDGELNNAFAFFKSENITDLVLDLRYNGGGSVRTATYLASMINGTNTGKIFSQEFWNEKVMKGSDPDIFLNNFTNQIKNTDRDGNVILDEQINSLTLPRIYFIVSDNTASASELVINGMNAYIDVHLVGIKTVGKQVGSITLYDSDNLFKSGANLNTKHTYAMQPIVLEIKNAKGENNANGYAPDIEIAEDFGRTDNTINLGVLGEKSDPLLETTINLIINGLKSSGKSVSAFEEKAFINSKLEVPFSQEMYVEDFRK
ncbi:S41 family peptidase [uncultured Polaribacter sp.]|uniref:S41 family peptidase n=1 Tax=uncultured Polaribacter sp. TaxID=174711 RepID=UPI002617D7BF|nr:S41 family peptidase [uncultured Polaribacter sp.]